MLWEIIRYCVTATGIDTHKNGQNKGVFLSRTPDCLYLPGVPVSVSGLLLIVLIGILWMTLDQAAQDAARAKDRAGESKRIPEIWQVLIWLSTFAAIITVFKWVA